MLSDDSFYASLEAQIHSHIQRYTEMTASTNLNVLGNIPPSLSVIENQTSNDALFFRRCERLFATAAEKAESVLALCHVDSARSHNASQPVSKLPVEVLRDIFDSVARAPVRVHRNLPQLLAVSSHWRQAALAYGRLWATIYIESDSSRAFGRFPWNPTNTDVCRLQEHLSRSNNTPFSFYLTMSSSSPSLDGTPITARLLHQHLSQARILHLYLRLDDAVEHRLDKFNMLVPLPKSLPNLRDLTVIADEDIYYDTLIPLLQPGSRVAPVGLRLSGPIDSALEVLDPWRLESLSIELPGGFDDHDHVFRFLQRAPIVKRLTMTGDKMLTKPSDTRRKTCEGTLFHPPLEIPTLKYLTISDNWAHVPCIVAPSSVEHLAILWGSEYDHRDPPAPHEVDVCLARFHSLRTLQVQLFPLSMPSNNFHLSTWLEGKKDLIAALIPVQLINQETAAVFASSNLPALRYLFVCDGLYYDSIIPPEYNPGLQTILETNQLLEVVIVGGSRRDPLVTRLRQAGFSSRIYEHHRNWQYKVLADMMDACERGDPEWLGKPEYRLWDYDSEEDDSRSALELDSASSDWESESF